MWEDLHSSIVEFTRPYKTEKTHNTMIPERSETRFSSTFSSTCKYKRQKSVAIAVDPMYSLTEVEHKTELCQNE